MDDISDRLRELALQADANARECDIEGRVEFEAEALTLREAADLIERLRSAPAGRKVQQRGVIEGLQATCDAAYHERNQVVAALASAFPSGIARTAIPGWDEEWHGCVYIDLPTGQASWHYHDREAHLFAHLPPYTKEWDGHTTEEKYERLSRLAAWEAKPKAGRGEVIENPAVLRALEDGFVSGYNAAQNDACRTIRAMVQRTLKSTPSDAGRAGCAATAGSEPGHTPDSLAAMEKGNG